MRNCETNIKHTEIEIDEKPELPEAKQISEFIVVINRNLKDSAMCYPLTASDSFSRFLALCIYF